LDILFEEDRRLASLSFSAPIFFTIRLLIKPSE
jgi:hypothetical protein